MDNAGINPAESSCGARTGGRQAAFEKNPLGTCTPPGEQGYYVRRQETNTGKRIRRLWLITCAILNRERVKARKIVKENSQRILYDGSTR
ncbi:hypothetical protein K0M31_012107, partial [Melipona bicolor]